MRTLSIAKIFKEDFGVNWETMKEFESINVEKFGKKIRSFNPKTKKEEFNLIKNIVRKPNSKAYLVKCNGKEFECSADHKVAVKFDKDLSDFTYMTVSQLKKTGYYYMYNDGLWEQATIKPLNKEIPILDIEVENTHNYFANGILSHNTIFGNPETTPGGNAPKFYSSIRLDVRRASIDDDGKDSVEDARGIRARVKNIKNKTSIPFRKGELYFSFTEGIAIHEEYLNFAVSYGFIEKKGAWYSYGEERVGQGKDNSVKYLKENPEFFEDIKRKVDERLQGNPAEKITLEVFPVAEEIEKPKRKKKEENTISLAAEALNIEGE